MLKIQRLEVGQLKSNCYLVANEAGEVVIVDPGDDADFIQRKVAEAAFTPTQIIVTHGHFDHVAAATELMLAYNIPFLVHRDDLFLINRTRQTTRYFVNFDPGPNPQPSQFIKGGDKIHLGSDILEIIHTPGHTPGSVSIWSRPEGLLFVGDIIFSEDGVGRTDASYANPLALSESIEKIKSLPPGTIVYPGHGEEFELS